MTPDILAALEAARRDKRPVVLATRLPDGTQCLLPDPAQSAELNAAAERVLQSDESGTVRSEGADWFLHAHNPPLRLIVVGAALDTMKQLEAQLMMRNYEGFLK